MAGLDIRPIDLMLLIALGIYSWVQTLTWGLGVVMATVNAMIAVLTGLGTLLLVRKLKKIVRKKR
jgi:threonine/homoserine/homoserine lactone efflux protein